LSYKELFPSGILSWIKSFPEKFAILIIRVMVGILWLSQGGIKLINRDSDPNVDFDNFKEQLVSMADSHPVELIGDFINNVYVPNVNILVWLVIFTEIFIGLTILFGLFSRLGALIGMSMTINLWIVTLGWGEWFWTYPLIFAPLFIIFLSDTSRQIGLDRILHEKFNNSIIKLLT
jgi:uncharacterized membrane protein YphA (DoxX/SURF4 family)